MTKAKFNREEVLDRAIELFWQHGYSASSMQQVVKATGLKPGSIYLAFESKDGLFKEALERYSQKGLKKLKEEIESAPTPSKGICRYLESMIKGTLKCDYTSCFLAKTSLELAAENNELHSFASSKLDEIEDLFCHYLEQDYGKKEIKERATSLMLHIFGLGLYGYQCSSPAKMRKGVREGLSWLPWD
ncbi:MAG: TetR/AcrR family transcriptional regulator [Bacteriovoracaceae bacterium]|nr:TetR/AcrR family transcriptional regulator [Bacteriovoracaceae bacterium]